MAAFVGSTRRWIRAKPGRARGVAVGAAVSLAVTGGVVVTLRHGGSSGSGRLRHERGALSTAPGDTAAGESATGNDGAADAGPGAPGTDAASAGGSSGAGPAGSGASGSNAAPGTTAAAAPGPDPAPAAGSGPSPAGSDGRGTAPATHRPPTTPSGGAGATTPDITVTDGSGWRQLPEAPGGGRVGHTAVWTGREMVVWGGTGDLEADPVTDGAAFDPAAGTWRKLPAAPISPRFDPQAFWTGSEVVVFGGASVHEGPLADGAAWNPASNAWRPIAVPPTGIRDAAVVAWAGDRLVVWGGATVSPAGASDDADPQFHNDGAAWVAADDTWVAVPAAPIPARSSAESVWTGSRLIVAGGYGAGEGEERRDGAAFDPVSGVWSPIADRPAPGSCGGETPCAGVWTGSVALFPGAGLAYDPAGNRWSAVAPFPAAEGRVTTGYAMVWTGGRLLIWGSPPESSEAGTTPGGMDGFSYDPAGNGWQKFAAGPLSRRDYPTAVWTGREMLVWGGTTGDAVLADGAAYRPPG